MVTSPVVIFETVFTLQHTYGVPRARIKELVEDIISLPGVQLAQKSSYYRAFDIYVSVRRLSLLTPSTLPIWSRSGAVRSTAGTRTLTG